MNAKKIKYRIVYDGDFYSVDIKKWFGWVKLKSKYKNDTGTLYTLNEESAVAYAKEILGENRERIF